MSDALTDRERYVAQYYQGGFDGEDYADLRLDLDALRQRAEQAEGAARQDSAALLHANEIVAEAMAAPEQAERERDEAQSQVRDLREQLETLSTEAMHALDACRNHRKELDEARTANDALRAAATSFVACVDSGVVMSHDYVSICHCPGCRGYRIAEKVRPILGMARKG